MSRQPDKLRDVIRAAATLQPALFVTSHVLGGDIYALGPGPNSLDELRGELSPRLGVETSQIKLIGSAKVGFSLNRDHLLRPFCQQSDLDFVVVAPELFDASALELRARLNELRSASEDEYRRLRRARENLFSGYIRPDQLPLSSRLAKEWFPCLAGPFEHALARLHPVKAWLFKSWQHAHICYAEYHELVQPDICLLLRRRGDL